MNEAFESTNDDGWTPTEEELFQDLKENKLTEDDVKRLITDGILTDQLVDKFLKKLEFPPIVKQGKSDDKGTVDDTVEGFSCETTYVGAPKSWDGPPGSQLNRWWDGKLAESTTLHDKVALGDLKVDNKLRGPCGV